MLKAAIKQSLAEKREEEVRDRVQLEVANAAAAAAEEKAKAEKARGGLLGLGGRFL